MTSRNFTPAFRARVTAEPTRELLLAEVRGRCRIDGEAHWLWSGATSDGYPRIWAPDYTLHDGAMRTQTGRRAVWHLKTGRAIPSGWRVFGNCGERLCLNPEHAASEAVAKRGAKVAKSGKLKGVIARIVANRATNQRRSKLTPEMVETIRTSTATGEALAAQLGVSRQLISKVRRGKPICFDAVGGIFTGLLAANEAIRRRA